MEELNPLDIWRTGNKHDTKYTWFKRSRVNKCISAPRIHIFSVNVGLAGRISSANIRIGYATDHFLISL